MVAFPRIVGPLSRVLLPGLLLACGAGDLVLPDEGRPEAPAPAAIEVIEGNGQTGDVGRPLRAPLLIQVTDGEGAPIEGASVELQLTSAGAGAEIDPSAGHTDAAGILEVRVVLGDKVGMQAGEARVAAAPSLKTSFTAFARAGNSDNRSPDADYNWHCEGLSCQFSDASSDDDGDVLVWRWEFGDGETSGEAEPLHSYPAPGTYLVTLTVTDNDGASDQSTAHVDVGTQ